MWTCKICNNINQDNSKKCLRCGHPKGATPGNEDNPMPTIPKVIMLVCIGIFFILFMRACIISCNSDKPEYDKTYWDAVKTEKALRDSGLDRAADEVKRQRQERLRNSY